MQWLDLLHGCLCEADAVTLYSNPQFQKSCEEERKEGKEVKKRHEEEIREREEEKKLLQGKITILEQELIEFRASRGGNVSEYASIKDTLKVEQDRLEEREFALTENGKRAKQVKEINKQREITLEEELQPKDIKTMAENLQRAEKTTRLKVQRLETENAEIRKELESKQHIVDTLKEMLEEKEHETWKLRNKIQVESEARSVEQKRTAEKHQQSFSSSVTYGKQDCGGKTIFSIFLKTPFCSYIILHNSHFVLAIS